MELQFKPGLPGPYSVYSLWLPCLGGSRGEALHPLLSAPVIIPREHLSIKADLALQTQQLQDPCPSSQPDCTPLSSSIRRVCERCPGGDRASGRLWPSFVHSICTKSLSVPACVSHWRCSQSDENRTKSTSTIQEAWDAARRSSGAELPLQGGGMEGFQGEGTPELVLIKVGRENRMCTNSEWILEMRVSSWRPWV